MMIYGEGGRQQLQGHRLRYPTHPSCCAISPLRLQGSQCMEASSCNVRMTGSYKALEVLEALEALG